MAKRILIGNGLSALEKPVGPLIDSGHYDDVVRLSWFKTKGFERFVGKRTDTVSTIHWKYRPEAMDRKKLILVNHYDYNNTDDRFDIKTFSANIEKQTPGRIIYIHQRGDDEEIAKYYKKFCNIFLEHDNNFTLGFRTIFILKKMFPNDELTIYGFDFFRPPGVGITSNCGGWYWDPSHNKNVQRKHPYMFEKICLLKMIAEKEIYTLNSVSNVQ